MEKLLLTKAYDFLIQPIQKSIITLGNCWCNAALTAQ